MSDVAKTHLGIWEQRLCQSSFFFSFGSFLSLSLLPPSVFLFKLLFLFVFNEFFLLLEDFEFLLVRSSIGFYSEFGFVELIERRRLSVIE
jgi:hypothetical protein